MMDNAAPILVKEERCNNQIICLDDSDDDSSTTNSNSLAEVKHEIAVQTAPAKLTEIVAISNACIKQVKEERCNNQIICLDDSDDDSSTTNSNSLAEVKHEIAVQTAPAKLTEIVAISNACIKQVKEERCNNQIICLDDSDEASSSTNSHSLAEVKHEIAVQTAPTKLTEIVAISNACIKQVKEERCNNQIICLDDSDDDSSTTNSNSLAEVKHETAVQTAPTKLTNAGSSDERTDNINGDESEDDSTGNVLQKKRSILWISSGKRFDIPKDIWQKVFVDGSYSVAAWTYYKNKIADIFDSLWNCVLIFTHKNIGKRIISLRGHCKHEGCRLYHFQLKKIEYVHDDNPSFMVRYNQEEVKHGPPLTRQLRGVLRDECKERLKHTMPATLSRDLLIEMDDDQYHNGNANVSKSDSVIIKVRSELLQSSDLAKDDFEDLMALQRATKDDPYIQKVISPFAVFMHSKLQYNVLAEQHRRKKPGQEVPGYLDATGNVVRVRPETSTHPVFYYPLLTPIKGDPADKHAVLFPVADSVNSCHGAPDVGAFLHDFNAGFIKEHPTISPSLDRIISDFSYANFHGVLHGFHCQRIQQYIYMCYKFAVGLSDYSALQQITKLEMCKTHLTKTFVEFVRKFFPSSNPNKKTTYEQKFIVEVLCSMILCRSYNVLKEIYRNMAIILLSQYESPTFNNAKKNLVLMCTSDGILNGDVKQTYKFDRLLQSDMDKMSECTTAYEYNESILKLPIYKSSSFYFDLQQITDTVAFDLKEEERQHIKDTDPTNLREHKIQPDKDTVPADSKQHQSEPERDTVAYDLNEEQRQNIKDTDPSNLREHKIQPDKDTVPADSKQRQSEPERDTVASNSFHDAKILPEFLKQFGGIIPLWTSITLPKGINRSSLPLSEELTADDTDQIEVEIKRSSNQSAESHMNIVKSLMKEKSLQIGSGPVKPSRFVKLLRTLIISHGKRYLLRVPRGRLNYGPKKTKDFSKVNKKIVKHYKVRHQQTAGIRKVLQRVKRKRTIDIDLTAIKNCKESWGKKSKQRKRFSYFNKSTLLKSIDQSSTELPKIKKLTSKGASAIDQSSTELMDQTCEMESTTNSTQLSNQTCEMESSTNSSQLSNQTCEMESSTNSGQLLDQTCEMKSTTNSTQLSNEICEMESGSTSTDRLDTDLVTEVSHFKFRVNSENDSSRKETSLAAYTPNGLCSDVNYYMNCDPAWPFVVGRLFIHTLTLADYLTLQEGVKLSLPVINYIFEYMMPESYVNLTLYAKEIFNGIDNLPFSIADRLCYMPILDHGSWMLYFFNTKKRTFTYYNPRNNFNYTMEFIYNFIDVYNSSSRHKEKLRSDNWKFFSFTSTNQATDHDSGVHVIRAAHRFITLKTLQDEPFDSIEYRRLLQRECIQFSDNMQDVCLICGLEDDSSTSDSINWSNCAKCQRWIHDTCYGGKLGEDTCPPCIKNGL
ncbi:uncharacterized protein LOC119069459 [Bradysia coprophila]|uniref:uncharacterized protein LOC119069459 n=1 Tax=Bradysia coprophila TaxID=38358 RepID=UPI00187DD3FB|nr:uncharacterized protein LOC119069459 [Bradysia coprophila]